MKMPANGIGAATATTVNPCEGGEKKSINQELWQACAGPLVNLPPAGTHVIYFPQGHSEQVAASMKKDVDYRVPSYPNLPSKLLCLLHNVTLHADPETDEVYAQMTLQPVTSFDKDALLRSDLALKSNKPQTEFFCKTLTASDTSTHGGFSVPRRAAEKIFPPLDFSMQPPAQELVATDLHDNAWTFRHIYRGQPKRHLLTTGWSLFVNGKRLFAGDSVLFIRDEKHQLLLGIRRANRQPANLSSSVLSSDSMHIGILAAAAHAAANNSPFTVFYNPRASPSEFVIPLAKYYKAVYGNQLSLGMRFRMMFETEDSGTRRYMGTITGINDLDPVRWKNSQWRNLQVGWDESSTGEKRNRVSIWEIEPVTSPFFICPPPFFQSKRPRLHGILDNEPSDFNNLFKRTMPWLGDDTCMKDPQAVPGLSLVEWMNMQQNSSFANSVQPNYMQNLAGADISRQLGLSGPQIPQPNYLQFNAQSLPQQPPQFDKSQKQLGDITEQSRQNMINQNLPISQVQAQILQPQTLVQTNSIVHQQPSTQSHQLQRNLPQKLEHQTLMMGQNKQQTFMQSQMPDLANQQLHISDHQVQLQLLQKLHQQQQQHQSVLGQQQPAQFIQLQDQQKQLLDVSQGFSRSIVPSQTLDTPQSTPALVPQSNVVQQQMAKNSSQTNVRFPNASQLPKIQQQQLGSLSETPGHMETNQVLPAGNNILTSDLPSCSTSPSSNNCTRAVQSTMGHRSHQRTSDMAQSASTFFNPGTLETISSNVSLGKDLHKSDVKPSVNIPKSQTQGFFTHQSYLDTSSSTTSVHIPQNDVHIQPNNNQLSYHPTMLFRETSQDGEGQVDHPRGNNAYETNVHDQLGSSLNPESLLANNLSSGGMLTNYDNSKDAQQDLLQFGVSDMTFSGIDPTINDGSFMNKWALQPQFQRMRTYTKVYKRGAVGRSIDISSYSGYEELKQDLARRFGIEGQLEGRQRSGWKLVYVDHENDVLLVGDDPWEEFVNCVRCIKILAQDQQTSLDGDFGNNVLPNQTCSSSDGGNG